MCRFVKKCTGCDVVSNQGEERVADQLCIGLADNEIQEDLLKDPNQEMSVEEMIRFIEVRASGKRSEASMTTPTSANELGDGEGNEAIGSTYRRQQRHPPPRQGQGPGKTTPTRPKVHTPRPRPSTGTRLPQPESNLNQGSEPKHPFEHPGPHPPNEALAISVDYKVTANRREPPTDESTAQRMAQPAHPVAARTTPPRCAGSPDIEHESAIFEQVDTMLEGTLNHQTWNRHTKRWTQRKSQPQPHLEVTIATRREDFRQHGHTLRQETQALSADAMADTGCQSCLAGPQLLTRLHLTETDLIPVNLIMHSASGDDLPIPGSPPS